MNNYIQDGKIINYKNSGESIILSGDIVAFSSCCGVALTDIDIGEIGAVNLTGVYELKADNSVAFNLGDIVYYDLVNKKASKTALDNIPLGICVENKAQAGTVCKVKIGLILVPIVTPEDED